MTEVDMGIDMDMSMAWMRIQSRTGSWVGSWKSAALVKTPGGALRAQMIEPLEVMKILRPINMTRIARGKFIFDMGQDMGGWYLRVARRVWKKFMRIQSQ